MFSVFSWFDEITSCLWNVIWSSSIDWILFVVCILRNVWSSFLERQIFSANSFANYMKKLNTVTQYMYMYFQITIPYIFHSWSMHYWRMSDSIWILCNLQKVCKQTDKYCHIKVLNNTQHKVTKIWERYIPWDEEMWEEKGCNSHTRRHLG